MLAATKEIWESCNSYPFIACSRYEADFWQLAWEQKQ